MNHKHTIPFFLLLITTLLLAGVYSAAASTSTITIDVPCEDGIGDTQRLIKAIITTNQRAGYDTIRLGENCTYRLIGPYDGIDGLPLITDDLKIEGNGSTIIRKPPPKTISHFRLIHAQSDKQEMILNIRELTLENGKLVGAAGGAAINSIGSSENGNVDLSLYKVTLRNNHSQSSGGAVNITSDHVGILGTIFENNSSGNNGGGLDFTGVQDSSRLYLDGASSFEGNEALNGAGFKATGVVTMNGTTFIGNKASNRGGAIYLYNSKMAKIENAHFEKNEAQSTGGAAYMEGGSLDVINTYFAENNAGDGGGFYWLATIPDSTLEITGETILFENNAQRGGGLFASGKVIIDGTSITDNKAEKEGGGIYLRDGEDSQISRVNFVRNQAGSFGGGLVSYRSEALVNGSIFSTNNAGITGGAMFVNGTVNLNGNLFASNEGASGGGVALVLPNDISQTQLISNNIWDGNQGNRADDLYLYGDEESAQSTVITQNTFSGRRPGGGTAIKIDRPLSTVHASNNVFYGYNNGLEIVRAIAKSDHNLYFEIVENEEVGVDQSAGNITADPMFTDYENHVYLPSEGSPAVDAGIEVPQVTTDFEGQIRPQGLGYDIGAFESPYTAPPTATATAAPSPTPTATPTATPPPTGQGFEIYLPLTTKP